jgi:hypothetical protein
MVEETGVEEIMVQDMISPTEARKRSRQLLGEAFGLTRSGVQA